MSTKPNYGIEALDADGEVVHYFRRQAHAYRAGFTRSSLTKCLNDPTKTHRNLRWRRAGVMSGLPAYVTERCTTNWTSWEASPRDIFEAYVASLPKVWRQQVTTHGLPPLWNYFWRAKPTVSAA